MRWRMRFLGKGVFMLIAIPVLGAVVMALWNAVVPTVFVDARNLDFLHAIGLLILCRILFGGFRGRGGPWHGRGHWARFEGMTPDEREQFIRNARECRRTGKRNQDDLL